ncbi:sodium/proline symporter [Cloacibacillus porcorum]|uniref:sodium/proline symporter n=1 Tax=Cloacibacillus porcorum TaxID=1197717 RepID=UPI0014598D7D|nr:sodium/proline symporter [Cloacibacillus porcorum]MCC8183203.1 sodium/proline symporter [Cloacibacillus porcorum]MDY5390729.1 sodium/proline symporter [Cloacibacillus porcorum]NMF16624.1 sodium/proline symporter [Cloacibacillus porcorum]
MNWALISFFIYLLVICLIGVVTMRIGNTYEDFLIGGRRIGPWVSSFALITSYMSGYTYTAAPGLGYAGGYSVLWWATGDAPGNALSFGILGRRLRKYSELLGAITLPEYYEKRFNSPALRVIAALVILLTVSMHLVAQWTASGKLLSVVFGTEYFTGMLIGCAVVLLYTIMGGYLAVVYTDFIQGLLMFGGTQVLFWVALFKVGGFAALNDKLGAVNPALVTPWGPDMAYYGLLAAATPIILIIMGSFGMPHITIKHFSMRNPSTARQAMLITGVFVVLFSFVYYMTGSLARVILGEGLADVEQAGVKLWFSVLPPFWAGLLSSAAVASLMSTADSFLLLLVSTIAHDLLNRFSKREIPEKKRLFISRVLVLIVAVLSFIVAMNPPALVFTIVIFVFGGMALAFGVPNLFSVFWKHATAAGVIASMVCSLFIYVGATLGSWNLLGLHPFIAGLVVAVAVLVVVSLFTEPPHKRTLALFETAAEYGDIPKAVAAGASAAVSCEARAAADERREFFDKVLAPAGN